MSVFLLLLASFLVIPVYPYRSHLLLRHDHDTNPLSFCRYKRDPPFYATAVVGHAVLEYGRVSRCFSYLYCRVVRMTSAVCPSDA